MRSRTLPLRPRTLVPVTVAVLATVVVVAFWPEAELFIGGGEHAPRVLGPFEYGPLMVAWSIAVGLAPRLGDWDRYGGGRGPLGLAIATLIATVALPLIVFGTMLLLPLDIYRSRFESSADLVPYAGNIAVGSLLIYAVVGTFGRVAGTLVWAATLCGLMLWQASAPSAGWLVPLTVHADAEGELDTQTRWAWIALAGLLALSVALVRRGVPLRMVRLDDDG